MIELLNDKDIIHIHGVDAEHFLHGHTTNDIVKKQYSYNFILNNQGRYLFDVFVFRDSHTSFYLEIHKDSTKSFITRLLAYQLRNKFRIDIISNNYCILYSKHFVEKTLFSLQDPRNHLLGFRSMMSRDQIQSIPYYTTNLYLNDKYNLTIVDGSMDLIYAKSIPIEYGANQYNAIDYHKGCYIGQEIISRVKHQGLIRKKIYKLQCDNEIQPLSQGTNIKDLHNNTIGTLCSIYKTTAIAQLREEKYLGMDVKIAMIGNQYATIQIPSCYNN